MGVTRIDLGSLTLIDISDTTAIADKVLEGFDFYGSDGEKTTGTAQMPEFTETYTLASGSDAAVTQDMGETHNYRYAAWPYTTCKIVCTLSLTAKLSAGAPPPSKTVTKDFTITVNLKNKTKSISGASTSCTTGSHQSAGAMTASGSASVTIKSITFS